MYIDSCTQEPLTAGISIFHDGLPKLSLVHCFDRGNVATFKLQSCQSKPANDPPWLYPIRSAVSHLNPKGPSVNQSNMYTGPHQLHINQPNLYPSAFYAPGNRARAQSIDGRTISLPSTFENTFISKQCLYPTANQSKNILYNDADAYGNCCKEYPTLENCRSFPDDIQQRPPYLRPGIPNTMHVEMIGRCMNNDIRAPNYCEPSHSELSHLAGKINTDPLGSMNPSMQCNPGNPHMAYLPRNPTVLCKSGNALECNAGYSTLSYKSPVVIDLVADEELKEKCSINDNICDNPTDFPNKHDYQSRMTVRGNLCESTNGKLLRCNSCQKELMLENIDTYKNTSLSTSSRYDFTSSLLCNECDRKNRIWDTERNVEYPKSNNYNKLYQKENNAWELTKMKSNISAKRTGTVELVTPCNVVNERGTLRGNLYNASAYSPTKPCVQIPKDNEDLRNTTTDPTMTDICMYCNMKKSRNQMISTTVQNHWRMNQPITVCLNCAKSWNTQQYISNNSELEIPIVTDEEYVSGENNTREIPSSNSNNMLLPNTDQETNVKAASDKEMMHNKLNFDKSSLNEVEVIVKSEVNNEEINIMMICNEDNTLYNLNNNTNHEDFLDIDENSFNSFINNRRQETSSPTSGITSFSDQNINYQLQTEKLNRKRKSSFSTLPFDNYDISRHVDMDDEDMKSIPTSSNFHIDKEQLQKLRDKVTPILKAKKWIRQDSLGAPTDVSSESFNSDELVTAGILG